MLVRGRLFYGRAMLQRRSKQIAVGLPPKHILNRLNPPQPKIAAEDYVEPNARQQMDDARHLAKYVFARQYGLASPFKFQTPKYASLKIPNFNDREDEIKGTCKTPKRLREVIPMLEKLLWRHGKCGYKPLRDHACPSKVKALRREDIDSSGILVRALFLTQSEALSRRWG
ncbi:hypothetical protein B0H16DRAFT_149066 [Mycena metata]|uniref:Uncharacterized protein n=1 Tax=Mycena metata TaxID=1033252 RepID=A0AAD7NSA4_9AGAR|nr:hypothetical protein B0H16DRAFT_149066 [Mycena metata]